MGIIINFLAIAVGGLIGSFLKKKINFQNFSVLGIGIMIISLVGFFENIYDVADANLKSSNLTVVVISLIIGTFIGEALHIGDKLSNLPRKESGSFNSFLDATCFFGIGGLQISGPILFALNNDSSQLILKSMIDIPFAVMFGICYGKVISLSAVPVAMLQVAIALFAYCAKDVLDGAVVSQLCAFGYIVLFFTGLNMICEIKNKINNTNMLFGIVIILLFNTVSYVWGII